MPGDLNDEYEVLDWRNAAAILRYSFPQEYADVVEILRSFRVTRAEILEPGGRKSRISDKLDAEFYRRNWSEKQIVTEFKVDELVERAATHKIDCYRNRIGLEIEWNSKDQTFVRDLNNFRVLFDLKVLDVGVIVTRSDHLQEIFNSLGVGPKYGASTTHIGKLEPRLEAGGGGGCPVLVFGITRRLYADQV